MRPARCQRGLDPVAMHGPCLRAQAREGLSKGENEGGRDRWGALRTDVIGPHRAVRITDYPSQCTPAPIGRQVATRQPTVGPECSSERGWAARCNLARPWMMRHTGLSFPRALLHWRSVP